MRHKARGIEVEHPAVFPVDLASEVMLAFSDYGDVVVEPFCASGTSIIAAEKNSRRCLAMEVSPADLLRRGGQALVEIHRPSRGDGRTFDEFAEARRTEVAA